MTGIGNKEMLKLRGIEDKHENQERIVASTGYALVKVGKQLQDDRLNQLYWTQSNFSIISSKTGKYPNSS